MQKIFFILLFSVFSVSLSAQKNLISGRVIDADSRVALPFVNIVINEGYRGGTTDIDGKFSLRSKEVIKALRLSYVGYESQVYEVDNKKVLD